MENRSRMENGNWNQSRTGSQGGMENSSRIENGKKSGTGHRSGTGSRGGMENRSKIENGRRNGGEDTDGMKSNGGVKNEAGMERRMGRKRPDGRTVSRKKPEQQNSGKGADQKESRKVTRKDRGEGTKTRTAETETAKTGTAKTRTAKTGIAGNQENRRKKIPGQVCPVEKWCGGCQFLHMTYEEQLAEKQKKVSKLLKPYCTVHKITGMEQPFHYRNKVHAVFAHKKDGTVISGTYQEGTHNVVPVESCLLEDQKADAIIRDIRGLLKSFKIKTYNEDTGYGLLRHVLIRTAHRTGEIMVVLVLGSPILPSKNNFVKALRKLHPEITTIVLNVNDKKTSMILGERETVLYGRGYIEDELCGRSFRISAKSFYQVNSVQTEALYTKAIQLASLTGKERVIDAYCGIGTIGLIAAGSAGTVIGVELNHDAVRDAVGNARRNNTKNITFYENDAGVFMNEMAEAGEKADVVFMDPPRSGSDEPFLSALLHLSPRRIVYISCNPETQARDLEYLTKHGYRAEGAWPFDMFPFANHVETVISLSRKLPMTISR